MKCLWTYRQNETNTKTNIDKFIIVANSYELWRLYHTCTFFHSTFRFVEFELFISNYQWEFEYQFEIHVYSLKISSNTHKHIHKSITWMILRKLNSFSLFIIQKHNCMHCNNLNLKYIFKILKKHGNFIKTLYVVKNYVIYLFSKHVESNASRSYLYVYFIHGWISYDDYKR